MPGSMARAKHYIFCDVVVANQRPVDLKPKCKSVRACLNSTKCGWLCYWQQLVCWDLPCCLDYGGVELAKILAGLIFIDPLCPL